MPWMRILLISLIVGFAGYSVVTWEPKGAEGPYRRREVCTYVDQTPSKKILKKKPIIVAKAPNGKVRI